MFIAAAKKWTMRKTTKSTGEKVIIIAKCMEDRVRLVIKDKGPGFPDRFGRFLMRPSSKPGGLGLGLVISKCPIEVNNGSIRHQNVHPHGARFQIELDII